MPTSLPATRVETFDVLVPAGTPKAAPLETLTPWNPGELVGLEVGVPDGPNGTVGFRVALAHSPVIPRTEGAWIVANAETLSWPLAAYGNTGAWSVFAYNSDIFDHVLHVRYLVADFASLPASPAELPAVGPILA
jgi:hypothetical protein